MHIPIRLPLATDRFSLPFGSTSGKTPWRRCRKKSCIQSGYIFLTAAGGAEPARILTRHDLVLLLRHRINAHIKALGDRHLVLYVLSGPIAHSAILLVLFLFASRRAHDKSA